MIELPSPCFWACWQCVSKDAARQTLQGFHIDFEKGVLVGTDGHVLGIYRDLGILEDTTQEKSVTLYPSNKKLPKPTARETVIKIYHDIGLWWVDYIDHKKAAKRTFALEVIEGTYPAYQRVIPTEPCVVSNDPGMVIGLGFPILERIGKIATTLKPMGAGFRCTFIDKSSAASFKVSGQGDAFELVAMPMRL